MGKGDKKTEKGKRWRGSHGRSRPKNRHLPKTKKA